VKPARRETHPTPAVSSALRHRAFRSIIYCHGSAAERVDNESPARPLVSRRGFRVARADGAADATELDGKSSIIDTALRGPEIAGQGRRPMHVKSILSAKGGNVFSIEPTATLETAVRTLAEHKIGALLVLGPDRRIIGILSERDIVRVLAEQGADVLTKPLAQVMTRKVFTCNPAETIGVIMERMTAGKFRHVPVIEQDQVVGVVSIGDVVKYRLQEMEHESAALRDYIQSA